MRVSVVCFPQQGGSGRKYLFIYLLIFDDIIKLQLAISSFLQLFEY